LPSFLSPLLSGSAGFLLRNTRTHATIADQLSTAFDSASRRKGLLGQTSFPSGSALLIAPSNAVHTFFMRFPIDVIFVARDGRIVKIARSLVPWRMAAAFRAYATIELAAGSLASFDIAPGDQLIIVARNAPAMSHTA
jgi:uncharacterized membrane protein (UPF0127 family)